MTAAAHAPGPKYVINIENADYPWHSASITSTDIRQLAGWEPTQEVVEVNLEEMTEVTLDDHSVIELKPGQGFAKKIRFQRG
jgi:hypothetical protein